MNSDEVVSDDDQSQPPAFTKQYVILKNIFEKLPIVDLFNAAQVCKLWSDIARGVRRHRRNKPFMMLYHPFSPKTKEAIDFFASHTQMESFSISDSERLIDFCVANSIHYPYLQTSYATNTSQLELVDFQPKMNKTIKQQFADEISESQMVVSFGTMPLNVYVESREHLNSSVDASIHCMGSIGYGVITTVPNSLTTLETESDALPLISSLAIPKIPGFYVKERTIDKLRIISAGRATPENCEDILQITPEDKVKGIVIISHTYNRDYHRSAILKALHFYFRKYPNVAFGGGEQHKILSSNDRNTTKNPIVATLLLICGDENVNVASVAMQDRKISKKNEGNIQKMKSAGLEEDGSFAFMFACNGRGYAMHQKAHVESELFRKYFPKTLLIGSFTGGEFFREYIPGVEPLPSKRIPKLDYAFTTVFILVSIKKSSKKPETQD